MKTMLLVLLVALAFSGCTQNDGVLSGVITFDSATSEAGDCYVFLDTDTDITNGYTKRVILACAQSVTSIPYEIDTADMPPGSYYLLGAFDFGAGNMDPTNPSVWEKKGWFGSTTSNAPAAANLTDLSGHCGLSLYSLG